MITEAASQLVPLKKADIFIEFYMLIALCQRLYYPPTPTPTPPRLCLSLSLTLSMLYTFATKAGC